MKRWFSLALAAALLMGLSTPARAADAENDGTAETKISVAGQYEPGASGAQISVNITWEPMEFTYLDGDPVWDAEKHEYIGSAKPGWTDETKNITVTNHSDTDIIANFRFDSDTGIVGAFDQSSLSLPSAVGTAADAAPSGSVKFGIVDGKISESGTLGDITVSIVRSLSTSDPDALLTAMQNGDCIKMTGDISYTATAASPVVPTIGAGKSTVVDLGGHTLNIIDGVSDPEAEIYGIQVDAGGACTLKNGVIKGSDHGNSLVPFQCNNSTLTLTDCTLKSFLGIIEGSGYTLNIDHCSLSVSGSNYAFLIRNNCTLNIRDTTIESAHTGFFAYWGSENIKITLSGNIRLTGAASTIESSHVDGFLTCLPGTYNFDPSTYVDTNTYAVSESGGIWTVTAK